MKRSKEDLAVLNIAWLWFDDMIKDDTMLQGLNNLKSRRKLNQVTEKEGTKINETTEECVICGKEFPKEQLTNYFGKPTCASCISKEESFKV